MSGRLGPGKLLRSVYLTEEEDAELEVQARRRGMSVSGLVRAMVRSAMRDGAYDYADYDGARPAQKPCHEGTQERPFQR